MIVFHGSSQKGLKSITYTEENSRFGGDLNLKHGAAIYLTTSENEAKAYATGGSYYKIRIYGEIFNSTEESTLINFIQLIESKINTDLLSENLQIKQLITNIKDGFISAITFPNKIMLIIGNDEFLYNSIVGELFNYNTDELHSIIHNLFDYKLIQIKNPDSDDWILCLDFSGNCLEILEEHPID